MLRAANAVSSTLLFPREFSARSAIPARLIPKVLPPSLRPGFGPQADIRSRDESIARLSIPNAPATKTRDVP